MGDIMPNSYILDRPDLKHALYFYFLEQKSDLNVLCTFNGAIKFRTQSVLGGSVPSIGRKGLKCLTKSKIKLLQANKRKNHNKREVCYQD
jgi:hypothetical protein